MNTASLDYKTTTQHTPHHNTTHQNTT